MCKKHDLRRKEVIDKKHWKINIVCKAFHSLYIQWVLDHLLTVNWHLLCFLKWICSTVFSWSRTITFLLPWTYQGSDHTVYHNQRFYSMFISTKWNVAGTYHKDGIFISLFVFVHTVQDEQMVSWPFGDRGY